MKLVYRHVRFVKKLYGQGDCWFKCLDTEGVYIGRVDYSKDEGWEYLGDKDYCSADCLEDIVAFLRQLEDE